MRISATSEYACRAVLELSLHWPNRLPVQSHAIAKRQNIPIKYLTQILLQLKRGGLLVSIRGKDGGYLLSKAPVKINLSDVVREVGGTLAFVNTSGKKESVFDTIWEDVEDAMAEVLDRITFEDVLRKARVVDGAISYQI